MMRSSACARSSASARSSPAWAAPVLPTEPVRSSPSAEGFAPATPAARLFARPCEPATITEASSEPVTPACWSALAMAASASGP